MLLDITLINILAAFGGIWVVRKALHILNILYAIVLRPERNLIKRYGENSYAVITGASDGLGKGFCFSLARRGFNIVLIARNIDKLKKVEQELKQKHPSVQTKIIVADFQNSSKDDFFTKIMDQVKGLDVSMLINNAGVGPMGLLLDLSEQQLKEIINVNCTPVAILSRHFLEKFVKRQKRSCIINVSSQTMITPLPTAQTYGASKIFEDYFSRAVSIEYPNIDVLSLRAGLIDTKLSAKVKDRILPTSADECAEGALHKLGYEVASYGHWKHVLLSEMSFLTPEVVSSYVIMRIARDVNSLDAKKEQ